MCRTNNEKVYACNWDRGVLYFVSYMENGDILIGMKGTGQQTKTVVLPHVYDNKYDVIAVLERGGSHVVLGKADGGRVFFIWLGHDGSIFHEQIGDVGVLHAVYFRVWENDYLSIENKKGEGIIFQYEEGARKFRQILHLHDRYILNVTETLENMLGVESYNVLENRMECIIAEKNSGKKFVEISFNTASVEQFCCDTGSYVIVSNVLGENRFFSVPHILGNTVKLLDIDYKAGHEYKYLHCVDGNVMIFHDIGATTADIVLYDTTEKRELCRIRDVIPYTKCIQKIGGELFAAVMNINSQLLIYSVDLYSYRVSEMYRHGRRKQEVTVCKKKIEISDKRVMDYIVYEKPGGKVKGAICMLHGGPNIHWLPHYQEEICDMTELGFKVFYPNYFGSSGYGKIDYTKQQNKWGGQDVADVVCLGEDIPPGNRILYGESYGGFLAFLTWLKKPELWDKVILYAPFFSPFSLQDAAAGNELVQQTAEKCGQPDIEQWIWKAGVENKEIQDTEFFVFHGEEDVIVPCRESVKIVEYLSKCFRWSRGEPKLFLLEGMGHSGGGIKKERQRNKLILSILEK